MKSSFNATTAFLLPEVYINDHKAGVRFQCHHGVPASPAASILRKPLQEFQCHHGVPASGPAARPSRGDRPFQCHHGVPASFWSCFPGGVNSYVSMPPRRSCFSPRRGSSTRWLWRFNATTAFLLPATPNAPCSLVFRFQCHHGVPASHPDPGGVPGHSGVSMPPRRSCFKQALAGSRKQWGVSMPPRRSCFRLSFQNWKRMTKQFQCHHGVPASLS